LTVIKENFTENSIEEKTKKKGEGNMIEGKERRDKEGKVGKEGRNGNSM
jgi:hypothetical protein